MNLDGQHVPAFSDQRVRQAMYQAIDRQSITDNIFLGYGEAAIGTQPPLSPSYDPSKMQPSYDFDQNAAKQLLADAGWTDTNGNGIVDKDGKDLKLSIVYVGGDATVDSMLSYLQEAWKAVGVDVQLENISGDVLQQRLFDGDFDLSLLAINLTPDGSQGLLFTCSAHDDRLQLRDVLQPGIRWVRCPAVPRVRSGKARAAADSALADRLARFACRPDPVRRRADRLQRAHPQLLPERVRIPLEPAFCLGRFGILIDDFGGRYSCRVLR